MIGQKKKKWVMRSTGGEKMDENKEKQPPTKIIGL